MSAPTKWNVRILAVLIGFAVACGQETVNSGGRHSELVDESTHIVTLAADHTDHLPVWETELVYSTKSLDSLVIGEGASLAARLVHDSLLVIAQGQQLSVIGIDGRWRRVLGRQGEGPGEFQMIRDLGISDNGDLLITDFLTGRITRLTLDGDVVQLVPRLAAYAPGIDATVIGLNHDHILAAPSQWRPARSEYTGIESGPYTRDPVPLLVYNLEGRLVDTIGRWWGLERAEGIVVPFARSTLVHGAGLATVVGATDSLDVSRYAGRSLRLRLVAPIRPVALTDEYRAAWDSAVASSLPGAGSALVRRMRSVTGPPTLPAVGGLLVDQSRNIWVGDYRPLGVGTRQWVMYTPDGQPQGKVLLPAWGEALLPVRTELLAVSEQYVVVLRENADEELHIEVRRIRRD